MWQTLSNSLKHQSEHPLAYRLVFAILVCSFFFTLLATGIQVYVDYRQELKSIRQRFQQIEESYLQGITASLWDFDEHLAKIQMYGIRELPDIQYLRVENERDQIFISIGTPPQGKYLTREFLLEFEGLRLGTLVVTATLDGVYSRLRQRMLLTLGTQAVKIFLVSAFILFIFQTLVTRHLTTMAQYARQFDLHHLAIPIELRRRAPDQAKPDELQRVVNAMNRMRRGLLQDMAERQRTERELYRVKNYLGNIIDSMPSMLIGVDAQNRVTQWNREAEKVTGVRTEDAKGELLEHCFPQLVEYTVSFRQTLEQRAPRTIENVQVWIGEELRYYDMMIYPLVSDKLEGAVVRIDDVTSRVSLEEVMIHTEKMMSIGGLAAGMAHEINNPLGIILQSIQNIQRRISPEIQKNMEIAAACRVELPQMREYLGERHILQYIQGIREAALRASHIVKNMLSFSRSNESTRLPVELNGLLENTIELAANDYDLKKQYDFRHIRIIRDYHPNISHVLCNATAIQQVILNILRNAAQALAQKQRDVHPSCIRIRTSQSVKYVKIEIEDNGPGMNESVRKRIFEPFYTTKAVGQGTGLGLSVSYFIITNNHQGRIVVDSTPGKGTKFTIQLPCN